MPKIKKQNHLEVSEEDKEFLHGGGSSLVMDEGDAFSGERQEAAQRDSEPDDFDSGTNVSDDRIRGAGGQSLAELMITRERGAGLEEHSGGLRFDRPEPNVNDIDLDEVDEEAATA